MKVLLILPTKWNTLDKRVKALSEYLSREDRLGKIYGEVQIDYLIQDIIQPKIQPNGVCDEQDILNMTRPHHKNYDAVGLVFPYERGGKYIGNYYPNYGTDYKMDFYVNANEKNKQWGEYAFEGIIEHELAGHAVALDLGLFNQGTGKDHINGADNTHFFFYGGNKAQHYKEINELWQKKSSIYTTLIKTYQTIIDSFKKKPQITDLLPEVKEKQYALISACAALGMPIRITSGFRSNEEQNKLYAQGRTTPGNIVTNAKGGESEHNKGRAFDFVFKQGGYNVPDAQWELVGRMGEQLGLEWGGRWTNFLDRPHLQLPSNQ